MLSAVLPDTGHAFLVIDCVIDCAGPSTSTSTIVVHHRDQRPWSPAAVVTRSRRRRATHPKADFTVIPRYG